MVKFINYNANPKGKKTTDCVVRALTKATGKDYKEVYLELVDLSLQTGYFINEKRLEDKFLENNGFVKMKQPKKWDNTKYLAGEIDKLASGTIIIRVAHHLTCVKDNVLYDIWDCRKKCISNYYIKK